MFRELLLGCGRSRDKRIFPVHGEGSSTLKWQNLVTLDRTDMHAPDLLCNLDDPDWLLTIHDNADLQNRLLWELGVIEANDWYTYRFKESVFDEVHAYEVLEHLGAQGDGVAFFQHFTHLWRILKPNGFLCATVPSRFSPWLWGDPSHRRVIYPESLSFLDQSLYAQCEGPRPTSMSDFRDLYRCDFRLVQKQENNHTFSFVLQAVKPSRWKLPDTQEGQSK